jgi:signal transduction histidine kinase
MHPVRDNKGSSVWHMERKQAEQDLKQRNDELSALNAIAATVSQTLDLNQILNDALDEVLQLDMFGGAAKGMLFRLEEPDGPLTLVAHRGTPKDHPCLVKPPQLGECLCGLAAQSGEVIISENCWEDPRHSFSWSEMPDHKDVCLPLKVRGKVLGAMNVRLPPVYKIAESDINLLESVADQIAVAIENARLFEAVSQQHERLQILSGRLAEAEEVERRRIARELHDQVGQNITALNLNLNIIQSLVPGDVAAKVRPFVEESLTLIEQTTERIRDVMFELRPAMLDEFGLVATLRWYGARLGSRTGFAVDVQGEEIIPQLTTPVENALFRIAQEALSNVSKHAQASQVTVTIGAQDGVTRLIIADDGLGFNPAEFAGPEEDRGWGLLIMAERAEAVGGRCWVESQPACRGTRVIVEVGQ